MVPKVSKVLALWDEIFTKNLNIEFVARKTKIPKLIFLRYTEGANFGTLPACNLLVQF